MTLPPLPLKCLSASCVVRIVPSTLMSNSRWYSSVVTSSSGANWNTPALFTSTSSAP